MARLLLSGLVYEWPGTTWVITSVQCLEEKLNAIEEIFDITFLVLNQPSLCAVIFFSMKMCIRTI